MKRQTPKTPSSSDHPKQNIDASVPSADTRNTSGSSSISNKLGGQGHQKHQQPSSRKRPRSSIAAGTEPSHSVVGDPAFASETSSTGHLHGRPANREGILPTKVKQEDRGEGGSTKRNNANSAKSGDDEGFSRLFRHGGRHGEALGVAEEESYSEERQPRGCGAWAAAAGGGTATVSKEDQFAAALLDNTLRSSCCMLSTRGGHSGLPVQVGWDGRERNNCSPPATHRVCRGNVVDEGDRPHNPHNGFHSTSC